MKMHYGINNYDITNYFETFSTRTDSQSNRYQIIVTFANPENLKIEDLSAVFSTNETFTIEQSESNIKSFEGYSLNDITKNVDSTSVNLTATFNK